MEDSPPPKRSNTGVSVDDSPESETTLVQSTERLTIDDSRMDEDSQPGPSRRVMSVNDVESSSTSEDELSSTTDEESTEDTCEESFGEVTCTTPVELAEVVWTIPGIQSLLKNTQAPAKDETILAVSKLKFFTGLSIDQPIKWEARLTNTIISKECPSESDWETGWLTVYICPAVENPHFPLQPAQARFDIRVDGEDLTCNEEMTYSSGIKTWEHFRRKNFHFNHDAVVAKLGRVDEILAPCNHFVGSEGQLRIKMNVFHVKSLPFTYAGDSQMTRKRRWGGQGLPWSLLLANPYNPPKQFL